MPILGDWDGNGTADPGFVAQSWVALWSDAPLPGAATPPTVMVRLSVESARVDDLDGDGREEVIATHASGRIEVIALSPQCATSKDSPAGRFR